MDTLSAVIITRNEARNIERCLASLVGVADEVIVLDSGSTDETEALCRSFDFVRFFVREWAGYSAAKNYANQLATHAYLLSIDADEALSPELKKSLLREKERGFSGVYGLNRRTNYCGTWIRYSGWYPDYKIRIFPKAQARWTGEYVHEELTYEPSLPEKALQGDLLHYSYYTHAEHRTRADRYSWLTAQKMRAAGKKASFLKPYLSAVARFVSMYFLKLGFLDGYAGWKIATISARSNHYKYASLRRLNKEGV